ncbi:DNA polymerase III subunit psi [Psychrobium sp. 1_MG-2023]|uniref:DNA polymerase III subunit psi n=1 Tax=Psychrobium sp. 1_MG-2023 TaxID=3062624 RepID=UPI000C337430|nr:DNA polymerase III subunit psi [Psychrobium sp. 1_MG-2023]MDP2561797.1 DNA polymerase III subunit psi [Psychrobium sp. 1_MG-2023]PKF55829.1 hypothetical protein CW748_11860 [Alteromonadales bacterium alter-6D02]
MTQPFSALQLKCLDALGIEQWQLKPEYRYSHDRIGSTAKHDLPVVASDVIDNVTVVESAPELVAQLTLAIDYCQQHAADNDIEIEWVESESNDLVSYQAPLLQLPPLATLFSDAQLKQQLWQHLCEIYR